MSNIDFEGLCMNMPGHLVIIDKHKNVKYANRKFLDLFEIEGAIGKKCKPQSEGGDFDFYKLSAGCQPHIDSLLNGDKQSFNNIIVRLCINNQIHEFIFSGARTNKKNNWWTGQVMILFCLIGINEKITCKEYLSITEHLTLHEVNILNLISKNYTNQQISSHLDVKLKAIEYQIKKIAKKLNCKSRKSLITIWGRAQLTEPTTPDF